MLEDGKKEVYVCWSICLLELPGSSEVYVCWSSLVAQRFKDPELSLLWHGFDP